MSRHDMQQATAARRAGGGVAFTLIELLVVIAIIGILAAMLLPALTKAQQSTQGIKCMNNTHQITYAWAMYASDNGDKCVNNFGVPQTQTEENNKTYGTWCVDDMDWTTAEQNTNQLDLQLGLLGFYMAKNTTAYKCPADHFLSGQQLLSFGGAAVRVRSYSMNSFLGLFSQCPSCGDPGTDYTYQHKPQFYYTTQFRQYLKIGDITKPSMIFVMLDEHPDSINDGWFEVNVTYNNAALGQWADLPASYHNNAGGFSFSDGHSEIHKWLDKSTLRPVLYTAYVGGTTQPYPPNGPRTARPYTDLAWMALHASSTN